MKFFFAVLFVAFCTANAQISLVDFIQDNVLSQLLADIQNNAMNVIQSTLNQLIGSLLGKRNIDGVNIQQIQSILSSVFGQYEGQVLSTIQQLVTSLTQNFGNLQALIGGPAKSVARVETLKAAARAKAALKNASRDFWADLWAQIQGAGVNAANTVLAALLNFSTLFGKRDAKFDLADLLNFGSIVDNVVGSFQAIGSQLLGAVTPHLQNLQQELINHGLNAAQSLTQTLAGISSTLGK